MKQNNDKTNITVEKYKLLEQENEKLKTQVKKQNQIIAKYAKSKRKIIEEKNALLNEYDHNVNILLSTNTKLKKQIENCRITEVELLERENKLYSTLLSMDDFIFVIDKNGIYKEFYQPLYENWEFVPPERFIGFSYKEILPPEVATQFDQIVDNIKLDGLSHQLEYALEKNGITNWFASKVTIRRDNLGYFDGITVVARNNTNSKVAEERLLASESKFRSIVENSYDGIALTDEKGYIIEWNKGQEEVTGIKRSDVVGKFAWTIIMQLAPMEIKNVLTYKYIQKLIKQILLHGSSNKLKQNILTEQIIEHTTGARRIVQILFFIIPTENGHRIACICRDITNRKKAEEGLKHSEEFLKELMDHLPDPIYVKNRQHKLIMVNDAYCNFVKLNRNDIVLKTDFDVFKPKEAKNFRLLDNLAFNSRDTREDECILTDSNNNVKTILIKKATFIDWTNNKILIGTIRDITERKQADEDVKRTLIRERELHQLKSRFVSTVSHEFRTPLAGILSSTQLLEKYGSKWTEEKKGKIMQRIYNSVNFLKLSLDEVAILGKDQSEMLQFNPSPVEIKHFCLELIEEIKVSFSDAIINFKITNQFETIIIDKALLQHILTNLLSNAIKYSPNSMIVDFYFDSSTEKEIKITIIDRGIGISPKYLKFIYEPFHRGDNVEDIKGTGLGMTIVKRCVDLHNGNINIKSKPNEGTTVTVTIPFKLNE